MKSQWKILGLSWESIPGLIDCGLKCGSSVVDGEFA
jgi:hypothetical protein